MVSALGNTFLEGLEPGLSVEFQEARAGCRVRIQPAQPTVGFGQQLQFTGMVEGIALPGVTWSIPGFALGSAIDPTSGLFTAGSIEGTVLVMATSVGNPFLFKREPVAVVDGCAAPATAAAAAGIVPRTAPSCDALQAAGGTYRNAAAGTMGTAFLVRLRTPDGELLASNVTLSLTGPGGWNGGQPLALTYPAGSARQFFGLAPAPVTGMYTVDATVDGEPLSDDFTVDAGSVLDSPGPVTPNVVAVPGAIRSTWTAVAGAGSYLTRLFNVAAQKVIVPVDFTAATTADLTGVTVYGGSHALQVFAFSNDMQPADPLVPDAFNVSFDRTFLSASVVVAPASGSVAADGVQGLTATVTGLTGAVTWSATGGQLAPSGNTAQWTAPSQNGAYTITATSVANPAFRGRSSLTVSNGTGGCTPELVAALFQGVWAVDGWGLAGPGSSNCVNSDVFADFLDGSIVSITTVGEFGTLHLPAGLVSYPGQFFCPAPGGSKGLFKHANFNFSIGLGTQAFPASPDLFQGGITLRSAEFPNLIPCHAQWFGDRQ